MLMNTEGGEIEVVSMIENEIKKEKHETGLSYDLTKQKRHVRKLRSIVAIL
jgi:hypothetical protein